MAGARRQRRGCSLLRSLGLAIVPLMADLDRLTPADPADLAGALAYALRYQGSKRVHNADEIMARDRGQAACRAFGTRGLRRHEAAGGDRRRGRLGGDLRGDRAGNARRRPRWPRRMVRGGPTGARGPFPAGLDF